MASWEWTGKRVQRSLVDLSLGALVVIPVLLTAGPQVAAFAGLLVAVLFVPLLLAASIAGFADERSVTESAVPLPLRGRWLRYFLAGLLLTGLYAVGIPLLLRFAPTPH